MKAQSQIFQYILFFLIGLAMFGMIANFYKNQASSLRERVNSVDSKIYLSAMSSNIIRYIVNCHDCDTIEFYMKFSNTSAGYYHLFQLTSNPRYLSVTTLPNGNKFISSIHNLNSSIYLEDGSVPSVRVLNFSYIKKTNNLILVSK